jgi:hypothetical protein
MPLSGSLARIVLSRPCPYCGHVLVRTGSWFQHLSHYNCESCQKEVSMAYDAKVELFNKHSGGANEKGRPECPRAA